MDREVQTHKKVSKNTKIIIKYCTKIKISKTFYLKTIVKKKNFETKNNVKKKTLKMKTHSPYKNLELTL